MDDQAFQPKQKTINQQFDIFKGPSRRRERKEPKLNVKTDSSNMLYGLRRPDVLGKRANEVLQSTIVNITNPVTNPTTPINSFTTIVCPAGTSPVADSLNDTLTISNTDGFLIITGNSVTDAILFSLNTSNVDARYIRKTGSTLQEVDPDITFNGTVVINGNSEDQDTRVSGSTDSELIYVNAGLDRVGIGTSVPSYKLQVDGTFGATEATLTGDLTLSTAGTGIEIKEGTNATMGSVVLAAGTVTVATTAVTANSRIFLTGNVDGGTPGWLRVSARVVGTSFTITSSSATDTSRVAWLLIEPA